MIDQMLELAIPKRGEEAAILPDQARGEVEVWREQGQICAYGYEAGGENWLHLPGVATFRFGEHDTPIVAVPIDCANGETIRDAFERTVLPLALQFAGRQVLHASGVRTNLGVVAFCGDSGTGKSTLAYAAGLRGHALWADDAVAFETTSAGVSAHPLPFRVILREASLDFFGDKAGDLPPASSGTRSSEPLAAVFILERSQEAGSGVVVRKLPQSEAFAAALAQAYCYRPTDQEQSARMVSEYLDLAANVPIFAVRFEPRFESVDWLADRIDTVVGEAA
jgi:hypothetical protein